MNWQLPVLIAQLTDAELGSLRERVEATTLSGTKVPDESLYRDGGINFLSGEYWFPQQASEFAHLVDNLYMGIFWISLVFFIGIVASMVYFCWKYRRKNNVINPLPSPSHNTGIEILWSVLPSILLVWMFYDGATGYFKMRTPREDAEEIHVMASRWNWMFTYPDGDQSAELHLVLDRPTRLVMQSKDVLHALFVPAFRQKMDIVPGRYTYAYIVATKPGQYRLACAEYCGKEHSNMRTLAEVHVSDADRKANTQWIKAKYPAWKNGERTYKIQCSGCHKIDGKAATGPALNLVWGKEEEMEKGPPIKVDRQYVQDSIWNPEKDVVKGFGPISKMNSFKGQLKEEDINDIVAFLMYLNDPSSVSDTPSGEVEAGATPGAAQEDSKAEVKTESDKPVKIEAADDKKASAASDKKTESEKPKNEPDLSGPDEEK